MSRKKKRNICLDCQFYDAGDGIVDYCQNSNPNTQSIFHNNLIVTECEGFKHG